MAPVSEACILHTALVCHPQRTREPERFSTYFRALLTAHLLRSKSGSRDEMKSDQEMKKLNKDIQELRQWDLEGPRAC